LLLTITCEAANATDLGYLLHKNPASIFQEKKWFGNIVVFTPEATPERCTVALLLEADPVGLVRSGGRRVLGLEQYVNDRPYVASSLLSVALVEAFGTAMNGRSRERPERVGEKLPLRAHLAALNCAGGEALIARLFAPLGYTVTACREPLDVRFSGWGESDIYSVTLEGAQTVQDLLTHLYVLIPVLDNAKHYFVGADEVDKLLKKGERWLPAHPEKDLIARRYLSYRQSLIRDALAQIPEVREDATETQDEADEKQEAQETAAEAPLRLNEARMQAALETVRSLSPPAARVLDLGCGEGRLLKLLLHERHLSEIAGVDVAAHTLERAARNLRLETLPERQQARLRLMQGSLVYRDARFSGFDVALLIEVIEHLDPPRLAALEQVVFHHARPRRVVVTTPNAEYNAAWPSLPAGRFRHRDHRFEWTRAEFAVWADGVAAQEGYTVARRGIGPEDAAFGCPTQMAVFDLAG
jgi:3' terminal RNA ribose 2'-O-methyltransferase Hen1